MNELVLFAAFGIKHFVVDFPLQTRFQYSNKGTYGHGGGILHSLLHGYGTFLCLMFFVPIPIASWLASLDIVIHYHVDWAKVNINTKFGWGPTTHDQFWWMLGFDQLLHWLTYVGIIYLAIGYHGL